MDELEGSRAQKWAVIEQALALSSTDQRDRKRGQTSLFDLIADDEDEADFFPPLPAEEDWSYLHKLEMEKSVLGFYMSGHPLFEYKSLLRHLCTVNSMSGKSKYGEMSLVGIVSNISRKKDNRGNPIAFVEMEDLNGKFEVPLFNRDYDRYSASVQVGKVFYIYGNKSQYNGNDDGVLRVLPAAMIPFDRLASELKGNLKIRLQNQQIKKGALPQIASWCKNKPGAVKLQVTIEAADYENYSLETKNPIFPDNAVLSWLENQGLEFNLEAYVDAQKDS